MVYSCSYNITQLNDIFHIPSPNDLPEMGGINCINHFPNSLTTSFTQLPMLWPQAEIERTALGEPCPFLSMNTFWSKGGQRNSKGSQSGGLFRLRLEEHSRAWQSCMILQGNLLRSLKAPLAAWRCVPG